MTKKQKPRRPAQDESQIALSIVEKAIGEKLLNRKSPIESTSTKRTKPKPTKPPGSANKI
jgi:hypothetical protein